MRCSGKIAILVGVLSMATGCGRKGALIYPDMLIPAAPAEVVAQQSGSVIKLQFELPDKDRSGRSLKDIAGVKISRRVAETDQGGAVCRSCQADYALFRTLYLERLPADTRRYGGRLIVLDGDVSAGNTYSYLLVPFTADGIDGAASAAVDVRVNRPLPAPLLKIETFPTEIRLNFELRSKTSGHLIGYNVYRSSTTPPGSYQPLNNQPQQGGAYIDTALVRGVKYRYAVRSLIETPPGNIAESEASNEAEGVLLDDE